MEQDSNMIIYTTDDGKVNLDVQIDNDSVWLTQQQIAKLYGKAVSTINEHLKNIFEEEELHEDCCIKKFGISEFQQKAPFFYNLDAIIAVGFRVRSKQGTLFRQWAIERLNNYIVKGFDIDSERLKEQSRNIANSKFVRLLLSNVLISLLLREKQRKLRVNQNIN